LRKLSQKLKEVKNEDVKSEVQKGAEILAERQRERRERFKNQLGYEEIKEQNQKKMTECRAKQQKEGNHDESEDVDDDNVSTASSTNNNNKLLSDDNKITCECENCYHKSYKSRISTSKHIWKD
jgi:hypothetical protein